MDEKCDKLLSDILDEANKVLDEMRDNNVTRRNTDAYINRLGKLTNVVMSVKTGLVLSNQPVFAQVPEFINSLNDNKEESK